MKTVFVLFDSLNRTALEPYGSGYVRTPNLARFAQRAVTFDNHYVGSLPCMPARRDLHTGRIHFLHRSWGPLEPFDDSFPELLRQAGVYTHIVTDHHHYFADGGGTYHPRYSSWELVRGQAIDRWKARINPPLDLFRTEFHAKQQHRLSYMINRSVMADEKDFCCPQVFDLAFDFLRQNGREDNWLLQIECFDPHEPFYAPQRFRESYPSNYNGPILDWPIYDRVTDSPEEIAELHANYAALVTMCDEYLGRLLDYFDAAGLWDDTALVVTTDHGFLLGEHDWWAKNRMPCYDEIAHIPLLIYHPDWAKEGGTRRRALTQTIDLMPTLMDFHGQASPADVLGRSLRSVLDSDAPVRTVALYGYFGAACNITDGRFTYFRYPTRMTADDLYEYTLMPSRMTRRFSVRELAKATLAPPFAFTKGIPVLRVAPQTSDEGEPLEVQGLTFEDTETQLYDLHADPRQERRLRDGDVEQRLAHQMAELMHQADAPVEMFDRLGLEWNHLVVQAQE